MFTVGKRERTNFLDERERATDGYRIWFVTEDGTSDYVEIPKSQYNEVNVKAAIEEAIEDHKSIAGL